MKRPNYLQETKNRIDAIESGSVFIASDFADIAETKRISECLERLHGDGTIKRVLRGVYYKPEFSELLGEYIAPFPDNVAHAIARNYGWTIVPCGDTALNLLGLSTQIPSRWLYICDGAYKEYAYDNTTIKFKRTTNKEISNLSFKTTLTIQALKALGRENITCSVINKLKRELTAEEKKKMLIESKQATSWVYEFIKSICKDEEK